MGRAKGVGGFEGKKERDSVVYGDCWWWWCGGQEGYGGIKGDEKNKEKKELLKQILYSPPKKNKAKISHLTNSAFLKF